MTEQTTQKTLPIALLTGIFLIAMSLRGPLTSISTLITHIQESLRLTPGQVGMLTTLPMIIFALFSPVISAASKKIRLEVLMMIGLMVVSLGIVTRSAGNTGLLFIGTLLIGMAITCFNVVLPVLVKRDFSKWLLPVTAMYTLAMGLGSGVSSYLTIPALHLATNHFASSLSGWSLALLSNLLLPVIALIFWLPLLRKTRTTPIESGSSLPENHHYLWTDKNAWSISLCLGLNAFMSYVVFAWLPSMVIEQGYSQHDGAVMQTWCQIGTGLSGLAVLPYAKRFTNLRPLAICMPILTIVCFAGLLKAPLYATVFSLLMGIALGAGFVTILSLFALRTQSTAQAATLSGKSQCIGYLLGSIGPVLIGHIHDVSSGWTAPIQVCIMVCTLWTALAFFAASHKKIAVLEATTNQLEIQKSQCLETASG